MLIVNADDLGKNSVSSDGIAACYRRGRITSASAMVFMKDSERAAELALSNHFECGLHLNFSLRFDNGKGYHKLIEMQARTSNFLSASKYHMLIYNPLLLEDFKYLFGRQYEEFVRLYGKAPDHINGHQHFHLCMNMILSSLFPDAAKIRRNFTFYSGEQNVFNRFYRSMVDRFLARRYRLTDYLFDISPISATRIKRIVYSAKEAAVELMVHPERPMEYSYLMSDEFGKIMSAVRKGAYSGI